MGNMRFRWTATGPENLVNALEVPAPGFTQAMEACDAYLRAVESRLVGIVWRHDPVLPEWSPVAMGIRSRERMHWFAWPPEDGTPITVQGAEAAPIGAPPVAAVTVSSEGDSTL